MQIGDVVFIFILWSVFGLMSFGAFVTGFEADNPIHLFQRLRHSFSRLQRVLIYLSFGPLFYIGWLTVSTVKNVWWLLGRW